MEEEKKIEKKPEDLKKKLEECEKLRNEYLAGWQRARADFLNYKKEEMERMSEIIKYANIELILKTLPILDNFELAENKLAENLRNDENVKGILQIKTQIIDFLKNQGIEEIKSLGEKFDPNLHEVTEEVEPSFAPASAEAKACKKATEGKESGIIITEVQKGYFLHGKVIRPARVKVAK